MQFRKKQQHITGETRISKKEIPTLSLSTGTGSLDHSEYYALYTTELAKLPTKVVNSLPKSISFKRRNSPPKCIFI